MKFLAFDTSTEQLSMALGDGQTVWHQTAEGGAQSSFNLIPGLFALLTEAGLKLNQLDAIVFGRGPGSFTGLRTACSVAQGLAFGAGLPVLPVNTLLAVAEGVRHAHGCTRVVAALDARMNEVYASACEYANERWRLVDDFELCAPEALSVAPGWTLAGNAAAAYPQRLAGAPGIFMPPSALAMLRLAPALMASGHAVPAHLAMPLYIRDKVAKTTAEREAEKAALAST
jgi:tRNA threonylcarbamoyladenosine biosynthesis protein TsaB